MNSRIEGTPVRAILALWALSLLAFAPTAATADATEPPKSNDQAVSTAVQPDASSQVQAVPTAVAPRAKADPIVLQHFRAHDESGLNIFEPPKTDAVPFEGKQLMLGFAFTQQFQGVRHENNALPKPVVVGTQTVNANQLLPIGNGFNNANANLYLDAQLARGMRVSLTGYLSSRHHQEAWVKDGYLLIDASPIDKEALNTLMRYVTLRIGHFEINYGDSHFRRSDNGNALFNPFVGNLLMDAFTTEVGGEGYLRAGGMLAMVGVTGGEIRGQVSRPSERSPSYIGKLGFDRQLTPSARVRLTGSCYVNRKSISNTLYSGSRSGSRYYSVLENMQSTETAQAWSGDVQPGFKNKVAAWVVNPFVKFRNLEFFGNVEQAKGAAATELSQRIWNQYSGEAVYRLFHDQLYVGSRYNVAHGTLAGIPGDVRIERIQAGGGWFLTSNIMLKGEFVRQNYMKFPSIDIRSAGRFDGFMVEGVVAY